MQRRHIFSTGADTKERALKGQLPHVREHLVEALVHAPHLLEVLDSADAQLQGRILVADHEGVGVLLEGGHRPHVTHPLLDGLERKIKYNH